MTHRTARLFLAIAGVAAVLDLAAPRSQAQSSSFEVASVRPDNIGGDRRSLVFSPNGITFTNVNLRDCIRAAYVVKDYQITVGGQLPNERYDIVAKAPGPASEDQLRVMLQGLLADRFKLKFHRETKELSLFALVVGKNGPKLKESTGEAAVATLDGGLVFRNYSMSDLAERLSRMRGAGIDRPVLDKTSLKGSYEFTLKLADNNADLRRALEGQGGEQNASIFTVVQQQLGLKLEPQKGPLEMLLIDHAEKASEN